MRILDGSPRSLKQFWCWTGFIDLHPTVESPTCIESKSNVSIGRKACVIGGVPVGLSNHADSWRWMMPS